MRAPALCPAPLPGAVELPARRLRGFVYALPHPCALCELAPPVAREWRERTGALATLALLGLALLACAWVAS